MSADPIASRNDTSVKGASRIERPSGPFWHQLRAELLGLLPATLSYSARLFLALGLLTLITALLVIYAAYENRLAYAELQAIEQQQRRYDVEWGQLLLERSTLASPSRIEKIARDSLQMQLISSDEIQVIDAAALPPADRRASQSLPLTGKIPAKIPPGTPDGQE